MDRVKDEKFQYYGKTNIYRGNCLKRGLGQFADLRGGPWQKRGGGVFEGGLIPQCTL